jgi:hypothetical protein
MMYEEENKAVKKLTKKITSFATSAALVALLAAPIIPNEEAGISSGSHSHVSVMQDKTRELVNSIPVEKIVHLINDQVSAEMENPTFEFPRYKMKVNSFYQKPASFSSKKRYRGKRSATSVTVNHGPIFLPSES